jgi:hypothetical protein
LMALFHQFFGQPGDNSFGSTLQLRGDSLVHGRDLCDPHSVSSS